MKKISVIVTVLNESHSVTALLTALAHQTLLADEIVMVDGGSDDGTVDQIKTISRQLKLPVKVFRQPGNRSVGRNHAITKAHHEIIAITDAGCEPHPNWLAELVAKYDSVKKAAGQQLVVIAGYYDARPRNALEAAAVPYFLVMPDRVDSTHFLPATRSMLLEKAAWQLVGGFDEDLDPSEDYALAKKLEAMPTVHLDFTAKAKVTWIPPKLSIWRFSLMIYKFARGDIKAKIIRPKVIGIFVRYVVAMIAGMVVALLSIKAAIILGLIGVGVYTLWAIKKNARYAPEAWYWLPILQIASDLAVMAGFLSGVNYLFQRDK